VRISVTLRWTSLLLSTLFIPAAEAAPGDKIELVRDLAGRVGPVIGSALACPDVARARTQSVIEKFVALIRDAASNEAQRSDLAQLFDRSVAEGRNAVSSGRRIAGWRNAGWRSWNSRWLPRRPRRSPPLPRLFSPPSHRPTPPRHRRHPRSTSEMRPVRSAGSPTPKSGSASPQPSPARCESAAAR
jgi:hypothetical protein